MEDFPATAFDAGVPEDPALERRFQPVGDALGIWRTLEETSMVFLDCLPSGKLT